MLKSFNKVDKDGNPIDDSGNATKQNSAPSSPGENGKGAEYDADELELRVEIAKYIKGVKQKEAQHASGTIT